jgi:hypothetical protein
MTRLTFDTKNAKEYIDYECLSLNVTSFIKLWMNECIHADKERYYKLRAIYIRLQRRQETHRENLKKQMNSYWSDGC